MLLWNKILILCFLPQNCSQLIYNYHLIVNIYNLVQALNINEFLKPAEGEKYYGPGRGRGRGRGPRGGYSGNNVRAPAIEDQGQFPTLGAK